MLSYFKELLYYYKLFIWNYTQKFDDVKQLFFKIIFKTYVSLKHKGFL